MEITTPLGDDVLLFHGMHAHEELSRPSEYQIDLLSTKPDIDVDAILGKNVTVKLALPDDSIRYFNGYVTRFTQHGSYGRYHRYVAVVRTWLWFLTRTADCRIFQEMTVQEILDAVFADHPDVAEVSFELTESYRKWTYCVQYRETDFNFVSRLMEHEGMYYYFRHTDGHNTLVITDSMSKHTTAPGYDEIPFIQPERVVRPELEHIASWEFSREVQPGLYVHDDYDLTRPSMKLRTQKALPRAYVLSNYEVFDYPGFYLEKADGEYYADIRIDEFGSQFEAARATTNARGVCTGSLFTLLGHPRDDQNAEHLILSADHELQYSDYEGIPFSEGASCRCSFMAMSSAQQFRPRRTTPKPFVQGPQTAVVVGPPGDEIHTDPYGRVKVQFHWDRRGQKNEKSSCWIRVSHPWAGKGWGLVSTPRIGQEVVIDFLEGDPDQPLVTGRVYNAECTPPFGFPAGAVISGLKSQTHKGAGYNEMSFDDTAGKEKITVHGQYDMNTTVEHDQTDAINNNRSTTVAVDDTESIGANQKITIGADRTMSIASNDTVSVGSNRTMSVGADQTLSVTANDTTSVGAAQTISVGAAQSVSIGADRSLNVSSNDTTSVGVNQAISVGANQDTSVTANQNMTVGANRSIMVSANDEISAGANMQHSAGVNLDLSAGTNLSAVGGTNVTISGGTTVDVAAGATIKLSAGGSSIEIGPDGIKITSGALVTVMGSTIKLN